MPNAIGIDLGTTNSVVSVYRRGQVETIPVEGRSTMPSALSVRPDGTMLVGYVARQRYLVDPVHSVISAKRFIGDGVTRWTLGNREFSPVDVSAAIISRLKQEAERFLGEKVTDAVITVPAYFTNAQKQATLDAGLAAGLNVLQLLPEPTAAAVAYGFDKGRDQTLLVYDLGGGTFDVSILQVRSNRFEVIGVDGDFNLGGDDLDVIVAEHFTDLLEQKLDRDLGPLKGVLGAANVPDSLPAEMLPARAALREAAEKAKIDLSESRETQVSLVDILGTSLELTFTRAEFDALIAPLIDRTIAKVRQVLKEAKLRPEEVDRVLLVGGSTRNRLVRERLTQEIKEPYAADRVDEAVAQGAAIVAASRSLPQLDQRPAEMNADRRPIELQDVTPFALGMASFDDRQELHNSIIIAKNTQIPCQNARGYGVFTTPEKAAENSFDVTVL